MRNGQTRFSRLRRAGDGGVSGCQNRQITDAEV
jgi:hypothetical protein